MKKPHLQLSEAERTGLQALVRQHKVGVKAHRRARAFLALGRGPHPQRGRPGGRRGRLQRGGALARSLQKGGRAGGAARPGALGKASRAIDGAQRATITALACSRPPEGHARWSLRLLAGKLVELGLVEAISHDHVGTILKKNALQPHLKKTWCIGELNSRFLAAMERVLWLYAQPHDAAFPVVCFDERPCFLIGEELAPLNAKPGQVAREHYAYTKKGSGCLFGRRGAQERRAPGPGPTPGAPSASMHSSCRPWRRATRRQEKSAWCRTT